MKPITCRDIKIETGGFIRRFREQEDGTISESCSSRANECVHVGAILDKRKNPEYKVAHQNMTEWQGWMRGGWRPSWDGVYVNPELFKQKIPDHQDEDNDGNGHNEQFLTSLSNSANFQLLVVSEVTGPVVPKVGALGSVVSDSFMPDISWSIPPFR